MLRMKSLSKTRSENIRISPKTRGPYRFLVQTASHPTGCNFIFRVQIKMTALKREAGQTVGKSGRIRQSATERLSPPQSHQLCRPIAFVPIPDTWSFAVVQAPGRPHFPRLSFLSPKNNKIKFQTHSAPPYKAFGFRLLWSPSSQQTSFLRLAQKNGRKNTVFR